MRIDVYGTTHRVTSIEINPMETRYTIKFWHSKFYVEFAIILNREEFLRTVTMAIM